ncbi:MAG: hypothetical protein ACPL07_00910, partial [Candidatus Bathyarchaeia archaeon]
MYPHYSDWGLTDDSGSYKFMLPTGNWVFIASSGNEYSSIHPNKGFYITYTTLIDDETLLNLEPHIPLRLKFYDENNQILQVDEIHVTDSAFTPIIPPVYVGYSNIGFFDLYVRNSTDSELIVLAVERGEKNYVLKKNITQTPNEVIISAKGYPTLVLTGYDESGNISPYWNIMLRFPEYYAMGWGTWFRFSNMTVIHVPAGQVLLNGVYSPPSWYYYFDDIGLILNENETYMHYFGGKSSFHLWVIKENTQLMFDIRDSFGNVVSDYASDEKHAQLTVWENETVVFNDDIGKKLWNWNVYSLKKTFADNATFRLVVNLGPLGGLGTLDVSGLLYSNKTLVPYRKIYTDNFVVDAPVDLFFNVSGQIRTNVFLEHLEKLYKAMGSILSENLSLRPHKVHINFEWCGVGGTSFVGFGLGIARWPYNVRSEYLGVMAHELGHMYSFTPPLIYYVECPTFCEPLATYLGIESMAKIYGSNFRLWYWGTHPAFFDHIIYNTTESDTELMQFIFFYLHRYYGLDIHLKFFKAWNSQIKDVLLNNGFNNLEAVFTIYSYLANENLAWILNLAGFNVTSQKIMYGVSLLYKELYAITLNVQRLGFDGVPGPILILNNQSVPIVSGDEDTEPAPSIVAAATNYGHGRVFATLGGFFTDNAIDLFDNKIFARNIINWLSKPGSNVVLISLGHGEFDGGTNYDKFVKELEDLGYNVTRYYGVLTPDVLSRVGVVMIGTAWKDFTQDEVSAILDFVSDGGGLLLTGLGW